MFKWLFSLFKRNKIDYGLYKPPDRLIYKFWNGEKLVEADPQVIFKRIMDHGPELQVDLRHGRLPLPGAKESHDRALQTIRDAFGIKAPPKDNPLDCSITLTELEVEELLDHFLYFCENLKKNTNPPPTSPMETSPPTPPPAGPSSAESQATKSASASGSTGTESAIAEPMPSPSGQESPSAPSIPA